MSEVRFTISVDTTNNTVTFKDNATDWSSLGGAPTTLTLYMKGEDKESYIVKKDITDSADIASFLNNGLEYTFVELFGATEPIDNFYLTEIIANLGLSDEMASTKMAVGFTYQIALLVHNSTLGVHIPIDDLLKSLTVGGMPQILEYLQVLSTYAEYTFDRENKWRKAFNYLSTTVNDLDY